MTLNDLPPGLGFFFLAVFAVIICAAIASGVSQILEAARNRRRSARLYAEALRTIRRKKLQAMPRRNGSRSTAP
jgi:hypothetical protein